MVSHPAFELLRKHKEVKPEVESLVIKQSRGKVTAEEMVTIFEKGITGEFGKVYTLDAQTLSGWIESYKSQKNTTKNYLATGLLNPNEPVNGINYPQGYDAWHKEVNKCFLAYVSGVSEENFHPDCYDRLMLDGKIPFGSVKKYIDGMDSVRAKQKCVRDYFGQCKSKGWNQIYYIQ